MRILLVFAAVVAASVLPAAETATLPSIEEVIAKHVEAIGGEKTFKKYDSRVLEGKMSMPAAGISGDFKLTLMAPNRSLVEVQIEGMGTIKEGFDGEVGWSTDPMSGPQLKSGAVLAQTEDQSLYAGALFPADHYKTRELVEMAEFNGTQAWKVRLVTKNDNESFAYFDTESGLQVGTELIQKTPMGDLPVKGTLGEYKEFDGLMIPTHLEQDLGPAGKQVIDFTSVTNGGVDPSVFALPAEIEALRE